MMNCVIVDDSKMARTELKMLVEQVDFLNLKKECNGSLEGYNYLKSEPDIDLVFLDVEMPGMTGMELIKNLQKLPIIILVTSKKDYAVEAFELHVADYLIKPVTLPRFLVAVDRAKELFDSRATETKVEFDDKHKDYIFVRSNSVLNRVKMTDILYIQALGDYVNIYVSGAKRYMVHSTLKSMEERLPAEKFFRLHRSYLIALDHIDVIEEGTAYIEKQPIPIGEQYKKELLRRLNLL